MTLEEHTDSIYSFFSVSNLSVLHYKGGAWLLCNNYNVLKMILLDLLNSSTWLHVEFLLYVTWSDKNGLIIYFKAELLETTVLNI